MKYFDPKSWTTSRAIAFGVSMTALCTVAGLAIGGQAVSSLIIGGLVGGGAATSVNSGMKRAKASE